MAIQLRKQNEEIALLALIDTYNFNGIPLRLGFADGVSQVGQKILFHWSNLTNLSLNEQMYYLLKKARGAMTREIERLGVILSNLRGLNHAGERRDGRNVFLERLNEDAHFTYAPQLYDGKMVVFKPRRNYSYLRDPQMGWNDFARDGMELVELPVDAGGIFTEPYVKTLADELRKRIDTSSNGAK
jgi:thioesterase domain-containing protein